MNRRIGRFKVSHDLVERGDGHKLFAAMEFVPLQMEHIYHEGAFTYIGLSPLFEEVPLGEKIPTYDVCFTFDENGNASVGATKAQEG